jgi:hypothetical protein
LLPFAIANAPIAIVTSPRLACLLPHSRRDVLSPVSVSASHLLPRTQASHCAPCAVCPPNSQPHLASLSTNSTSHTPTEPSFLLTKPSPLHPEAPVSGCMGKCKFLLGSTRTAEEHRGRCGKRRRLHNCEWTSRLSVTFVIHVCTNDLLVKFKTSVR